MFFWNLAALPKFQKCQISAQKIAKNSLFSSAISCKLLLIGLWHGYIWNLHAKFQPCRPYGLASYPRPDKWPLASVALCQQIRCDTKTLESYNKRTENRNKTVENNFSIFFSVEFLPLADSEQGILSYKNYVKSG